MDSKEINDRLLRIERLTLLAAKNVLDIKDVALLTGRKEKTIRNRLKEIPHYYGGMGLVFKRDEIEAYMCKVRCCPVELKH